MPKLLEFHDATVERIQWDAEGVTVRFARAFAYSSWNASNVDLDSGRYYPAEIHFETGTMNGELPDLNEDATLSTGWICVDGGAKQSHILVPADIDGQSEMCLTFVMGSVVSTKGSALTIRIYNTEIDT